LNPIERKNTTGWLGVLQNGVGLDAEHILKHPAVRAIRRPNIYIKEIFQLSHERLPDEMCLHERERK